MPEDRFAGQRTSTGLWSLVCGLASVVGVLMIGQASFGWIPAFDPAGWLRVVSGWLIPIGVIGGFSLGVVSVRRGSGRRLGVAGMVAALVAVGGFVAMLVSGG